MSKNIGLYTVGDTFDIPLDGTTYPSIRNLGPDLAKNVVVTITLPTGLDFDAGESVVPRGTFNETTGEWSIGTLLIGEALTPTFNFEITDDCQDEYLITFEITSDMCECNFANNSFSVTVYGTSCCSLASCIVPAEKSSFTSYLDQDEDFDYDVCDDLNKVLLVNPTDNITITLVGGAVDCISNEITIKHIGEGSDRANVIRVVADSGSVDGDTYFEFDNTGAALNNARGYNFSAFNFKWDGTDFWVF